MVAPDNLMESPMERPPSKDQNPPLTNGNDTNDKSVVINEEVPKQPSYVALACCISGYSTLAYDSKQRQGLRSRAVSPFRTDSIQNASYKSECGNYLIPTPKDLDLKMQTEGNGVDVLNGCGSLHSPRHVASVSLSQENRNYTSVINDSYSTFSKTSKYSYSGVTFSTINGGKTNGESKLITPTNIAEQIPQSSFIMQRVERLYGPGALAQGFYSPRKNTNVKTTPPKTAQSLTSIEKNDDSLPVLKLLRPEFRAQLTVASRKNPSVFRGGDKYSSLNEVPQMEKLTVEPDVLDATAAKQSRIPNGEVKDGNYYLMLLTEQVNLLESLAEKTEKELETCENEEGCGILRAAAGKARLLIAQKLNQFRGLCHKNIKQSSSEDFPTTNEDLAGFWDMVMIQVNDVLSQFDKIADLRKSNWKSLDCQRGDNAKQVSPTSSINKKITQRKPYSEPKTTAASKARDEARRKLIEEKRKALRKQNKEKSDPDLLVL